MNGKTTAATGGTARIPSMCTTRLLVLAFLLLAAVGCPGHKKLTLPGIFEACGENWEVFVDDTPSALLIVSRSTGQAPDQLGHVGIIGRQHLGDNFCHSPAFICNKLEHQVEHAQDDHGHETADHAQLREVEVLDE